MKLTKIIGLLFAVGCITCPVYAEWGWLAFKAGAGYTQPVGGINSRVNGGFNLNVGAGANLGPHLSILAEYTPMHSGFSDSFRRRNDIPGGSMTLHALTVSPVVRLGGDRRISPYVTGGFGWYRRTVEITQPSAQVVTIFDPWWGVIYPAAVPVTEVLSSYAVNKGGWNAGAGVDIKFGDSRAKLFAEARYHYVPTRPVATEMLPVTIGVRW